MTRWFQTLAGAALLALGLCAPAWGASKPFSKATIHMEQNATDGDYEVVIEAVAGDEGLARLTVVSPAGVPAIDFTAPGAPSLGVRQLRFESPEPEDLESLAAAFPEGEYRFAGITAAGDSMHATASLRHGLPAGAVILSPKKGARGVAVEGTTITWAAAKDVSGRIVELEQEGSGNALSVNLPGSATSFAVPPGFLVPGMRCVLGIGTVGQGGNATYVEISFTTAAGK